MMLIRHTLHYGRFQYILKSSHDPRWNALRNLVDFYSQKLGLSFSPLPFFDDQYYSAGSFTYYKWLRDLEKEYYILAVDHTDATLFWVLTIHELAHCWLSNNDQVGQISTRHLFNVRELDMETAEGRLEEALCDIIATRLVGPAYPYAFVNKLIGQFPLLRPSRHYPTFSFRIECMARALVAQGFNEDAADIRDLAEQHKLGAWEDEEISSTIDDLQEAVTGIMPVTANKIETAAYAAAANLAKNPPTDIPALFYSAWIATDKATNSMDFASTVKSVSGIILDVLERTTMAPDSHA